jgi:hypothetical protein
MIRRRDKIKVSNIHTLFLGGTDAGFSAEQTQPVPPVYIRKKDKFNGTLNL